MVDVLHKPMNTTQRKDVNLSKKATNLITSELFSNVRKASLNAVKSNLIALKKLNGNIDARNLLGNTVLHLAVWRNHIPIVRLLLEFGANPDARDTESGWTSLHRAFYFGHLAAASVLINNGASLNVEDYRQRTPIDLISCSTFKLAFSTERFNEVYSWGNGSNYQLGTGTAGIHRLPTRIESLQGQDVIAIASARFHNVAITSKGSILSWGFGRGGRLGHSNFDIHSGQVAVIFPHLVSFGSGVFKHVKCIAVAKHHTIISTTAGEVYTWGNNREGRLGYNSVDTQATPRRVSSLKMRVANVAASNKHSIVVTNNGEVWTFGCNRDGQLGYGTSNSSSNCIPRIVEYFRGRQIVSASAAKCHTLVLSSEGEVFSWGHRMVTPRKVIIAREMKKFKNSIIKFHKQDRFRISCIAAGYIHSTALSDDGMVFVWPSDDANLKARQMALPGHQALSVSAGKYHTAVVTKAGDVFSWEGSKSSEHSIPSPHRILGLKHVCSIGVGENHFVAVTNLHIPIYPSHSDPSSSSLLGTGKGENKGSKESKDAGEKEEDADEENELSFDSDHEPKALVREHVMHDIPSLQDMCQKVIAFHIAEPRNAIQLLEIANSLQSPILKSHCEEMVGLNLDYILTTVPQQLTNCSLDVLAEYESKVLSKKMKSTNFCLPSPTVPWNVVLESTEEEERDEMFSENMKSNLRKSSSSPSLSHLQHDGEHDAGRRKNSFMEDAELHDGLFIAKQLRVVRKKLQQIEVLESKMRKGQSLDSQQKMKIKSKKDLEICLQCFEAGMVPPPDLFDLFAKENEPENQRNGVGKTEEKKKKKKERNDSEKRANDSGKNVFKINEKKEIVIEKQNIAIAIAKSPVSSAADVNPTDSSESKQSESKHSELNTFILNSNVSKSRGLESRGSSILNSKMSDSKSFAIESAAMHASEPKTPEPKNSKPKSSSEKKKNVRKGGLSQFLSGALERREEKVSEKSPIILVKKLESSSPAWGGIKPHSSPFPPSSSSLSASAASSSSLSSFLPSSLRDIQNQQNEESILTVGTPTKKLLPSSSSFSSSTMRDLKQENIGTNRKEDKMNDMQREEKKATGYTRSPIHIPISHLVQRTSPMDAASRKLHSSEAVSLPKASPPAWNSKPNSGSMEKASFKDIQQQQEEYKAKLHNMRQQASIRAGSASMLSSSPHAIIGGFEGKEHDKTKDHPSFSSTLSHSPASPATNRWYRPEETIHTSLHHIQIEESAMKELRKKFGNVRVVYPSSR